MKKIEINLDELNYLREKYKNANKDLQKYYDLKHIQEELDKLLNEK